jgi:hypothetical protein
MQVGGFPAERVKGDALLDCGVDPVLLLVVVDLLL